MPFCLHLQDSSAENARRRIVLCDQTTNAAGKTIGASHFMFNSLPPNIRDVENGWGVDTKVGCTAIRCRLPREFDPKNCTIRQEDLI